MYAGLTPACLARMLVLIHNKLLRAHLGTLGSCGLTPCTPALHSTSAEQKATITGRLLLLLAHWRPITIEHCHSLTIESVTI